MAKPQKSQVPAAADSSGIVEALAHKVIIWWLPLLYLLISSLFFLRTYDSAQVKITVMQMGGLALLTLWLVRLFETGRAALSKDDLVCLSPFLAYLLVGILSFLHAPYHMASVDFFLRHFFFMTAALIVIYEFDANGIDRLNRILTWAAWIAVGYGFLQYLDVKLFPIGVGKGIDPFIWRWAFGDRVFSTYGNPNFFADFLVIVFPILLMQFLKTRSWSLVVLMILLLIDLIATGTKGAWIGFAMVCVFFGAIAFVFYRQLVAPYRKFVYTALAVGALGFLGYVGKDLRYRMVSVNFRLFTWEGTWEMIRTHPFIGSGVGSFPPLYPAFRRPPIFHIEGKHNTETDHAEDEYIEQLFDNGILGFGVFLWMIFSTFVVGFRSLRQLTTTFAGRDGRPPPRAYDITGYIVAFLGMLGHNFFDVSMRFVSSGVYLGLLSGTIVNLARGKALYELHDNRAKNTDAPEPESGTWKLLCEFLIWPARLAAWAGLLYVGWLLIREFRDLQGPLGRLQLGGEVLQWWLAWGTFLACVLSLTGVFMRLIQLTENPLVPGVILAALFPLYIFWGYFKADVHHNIAIYFSKERNWDQALSHYGVVQKLNPNFVMSLYFRGNVFNDRFNMSKVYNPAWGDTDNVARDDYERALEAYDDVRRLAPNYVQSHHQVGALHMKRAEFAANNGRPDEAEKYLDRAMTRFLMYQALDPVFAPNYYRMGQIHMGRKNYAAAAKVYRDLIEAKKCEVDPALMRNKFLQSTILTYQLYVKDARLDYPAHRHETADAYMNLGNALFLMENMGESEEAYRRALAVDPNYEPAKRNLGILYQKAQSMGRLKTVASPALSSSPIGTAFTGFEIIPSKK